MAKRYGIGLPLLARSNDFEKAFEDNERNAVYKATATYQGAHLQVLSRNKEHYERTLDYWKKLKATNIAEA